MNKRFWVLVGTRPEVIKQASIYSELVERYGKEQVALVGTGQHRELLDQALAHFDLKLDADLAIMRPNQSLPASSAAVLEGVARLFEMWGKPAWLVVQGDTTSAAMAAWAGFQSGIKVAHNEAGLRSYDLQHPFPEEANRRLISIIATAHFVPTERARAALVREGVPVEQIFLTGNSGIDALRLTLNQAKPARVQQWQESFRTRQLTPVLVTAHRRENRDNMDGWFQALGQFLDRQEGLALVFPFHPNHAAVASAEKYLRNHPRAEIVPAIDYAETCHLLDDCRFVITDSGGIQEEAASLGVPVVVCRKTTERMEAVDAGIARLAGTDTDNVIQAMEWAIQAKSRSMRGIQNHLFGDGYAAKKVVDNLCA